MGFFGVPLSGLIAAQDQLQSVSNNLANVDTVGFKDQTVSFSDVFAQSSLVNASNNPIETGLGVSTSQSSSDFTDGGSSTTGINSNMELTGNGFFVVQGANGSTSYTRAGDFTVNSSGQLTTPDGQLVMGFPPTTATGGSNGVLQPLQVGTGAVIPATATQNFQITANLSSTTPVNSSFTSTVPIFDSLGSNVDMTVTYTKTASNAWNYSVNVPTAETGANNTQVASGSLNFDSSGNLTSTTDSAGNVTTPASSIAINIGTLADGAAPIAMNWNLVNAAGGSSVTQTSLASSSTPPVQDGQASGTLTGFSVLTDGTIEGTYTNAESKSLGQVAVASFANNQGLMRTGDNDYQATVGSGDAAVGVANTGGRGTITGGAVEDSNVDTAAEFSKLIVAQQAYQANAKTVTTFDQISQATIAMIST